MSNIDNLSRARLLRIARSAIESHLTGQPDPDAELTTLDLPNAGAFVTLRKAGLLRGCIGTFDPHGDLFATVRRMAVAASHDPRFTGAPITAAELRDTSIEISVLTPLEPISDPLDIEIGRHGIYILCEGRAGCFLPEVASERNWDAATFLSRCCEEKAGLDALAWQDPATQVFVFTVVKCSDV